MVKHKEPKKCRKHTTKNTNKEKQQENNIQYNETTIRRVNKNKTNKSKQRKTNQKYN